MDTFLMFIKAFLVGGGICMIGQIIINFTHLTNGKILVLFLISGAVLEGFGLYSKLIEFAGAGASVPISGLVALSSKEQCKPPKRRVFSAHLKADLPPVQWVFPWLLFRGTLSQLFSVPKQKSSRGFCLGLRVLLYYLPWLVYTCSAKQLL